MLKEAGSSNPIKQVMENEEDPVPILLMLSIFYECIMSSP